MTNDLALLMVRDLNRLKKEIAAYSKEANLWIVDKSISNCAGNLALHLIGNLNCYIGAELGKSGYIRDREAEFGDKNVPKSEIIKRIDDLIPVISLALENLSEDQLDEEYPILVFQEKTKTRFFLIHLYGHLNYHLGQINYHRRLLDF